MNFRFLGLLPLLAIAVASSKGQTPLLPAPAAGEAVHEYDTRGSFSTSASRSSVFRFPDTSQKAEVGLNTLEEVGPADMITRFVRPHGVILGQAPKDGKVMIGNQFFGVNDILRLEADVPKNFRYTYPTLDLVVREITDMYIEFYQKEADRTYKVALSFLPDVGAPKRTTDLGEAKIRRIPEAEAH